MNHLTSFTMPAFLRYTLIGLMLVTLAGAVHAESPGAPSGWLNVRDCGASGSAFETTATTTAGSNQVEVRDVGDFQVGQGVSVSRANIQYHDATLWGPDAHYFHHGPLGDAVEMQGYDGGTGSWFVFILEVDGAEPTTFRWSDDLARSWKQTKVPVTFDWQPLSNGVQVKFKKQDWQPGHMVTFSARDQLVTTIEKIEGNVLTLKAAANRAAEDAVVRHCDRDAIQAAVTRAIKEKQNLFFPAGHYRVPGGVYVSDAALEIAGASGENTILDISDGTGACFALSGGREVTIRNFRMVGHTGIAESPAAFQCSNQAKNNFWASALKSCSAVTISGGTQRVLVENVHASRMASECFYCRGPGRVDGDEPEQYTKSLTFLRCTVTDCCANAFNNNDTSENTSILYCRVDGAGWQAYEGPGRFIKIIGNYVRNSPGGLWVGSMNSRDQIDHLGCGQAVIADNVIEGIGGNMYGIHVERGASQVVVANNLFINYANNYSKNCPNSAICVSNATTPGLPASRVTVTGNIIDLTTPEGDPQPRIGINVSTSGTIVCNNQVYVRGATDPTAIGISLAEPALDVIVHDNLIRNCRCGLQTVRAFGQITEVIDPTTFLCAGLPHEGKLSHGYRGWNLVWMQGPRANQISVIESFDPQTLRFHLKEPCELAVGDTLSVMPPSSNWNLHDNTIADCLQPVILDAYGNETVLFRNNMITRGAAVGVKHAVSVWGMCKLIGNHFCGFEESGSAALMLSADPFNRMAKNMYRDNIFEHCDAVLADHSRDLWNAAQPSGNVFSACKRVPEPTSNDAKR